MSELVNSIAGLISALSELTSEESKLVYDTLIREQVTLKQLATDVTEDELEEIGITKPELRSLIFTKARVIFKSLHH